MRILIIIPAYNEGAAIRRVIRDLEAWRAGSGSAYACDYIVINDGSSDDTRAVLEEMGYPALHLPMNLGIGGAVQTGYLYARQKGYDAAIQMDGDGQHLPAYIDALMQPLLKGEADLSVGSRFLEEGGFRSSALRRFGIHFLAGAIRLVTGRRLTDVTSGFRAANSRGIALFAGHYAKDYPEPESLVQAMKAGLIVKEVPVRMAARETGTSSIGAFRSAYYMVKVTLAVLIAGMRKTRPREETE